MPSLTVFYIRAGGDDSLIMAHSDEDIRILHADMLNADDGWSFELKMMERDQPLSFFDVELRRCLDSNHGLWIVQTGVHFKPTDALLRTHADSFWPRAHQDALLRSHLLRITRLCSTRETVTQAARTVGRLLARRRHPLEDLIDSLRQLEPQFLCDMIPPRHVCDSRDSFLVPWYRPFVPPRPKKAPKLLIKMPFIGPASTVLRRVILETWTGIERFRLSRDDVCITYIPFKCLSRLLPGAKRHPSALLFGNAVYMIRDSVSSGRRPDWCGIGQVGTRPLLHRIIEHCAAVRRGEGAYAHRVVDPFRGVRVLRSEEDPLRRLVFEALFIALHPGCLTRPSFTLELGEM